jgi:hypothetical protein
MKRATKKARFPRPPIPAPKMFQVAAGQATITPLSTEAFRTEITKLRAKHRAILADDRADEAVRNLAIIVVAQCSDILRINSDDIAATIAVRSAVRLGAILAQQWNSEIWDAKSIGQVLASDEARKLAGIEGNETKSLVRNPQWIAVKKIFDENPVIRASQVQKRLADSDSDRPEKRVLQRWLRDLKKGSFPSE